MVAVALDSVPQPDRRRLAAQELLKRRQARDHMLAFTEYTHPKWETGDHHIKICFYLELLEQQALCPYCHQPIDKLANFAPPRTGKTELSLRRFTAWCMGRHPSWHVISAMANGRLAANTGRQIRNIVKSREFQAVFPGVILQPDAKAADMWVVQKGREVGEFFSAGVDASFPGRVPTFSISMTHIAQLERLIASWRGIAWINFILVTLLNVS